MIYSSAIKGIFLKRPNRFIAHVLIDDKEEIVHVKNTGRCKELLIEGVTVILEKSKNPDRKTKYSLIGVYKGDTLINIDSQIPNKVVYDALKSCLLKDFNEVTKVSREVTFGSSRFDVYYETALDKGFIEVKGVTLEKEKVAMFPDAPTERGAKHVYEMIKAVEAGFKGCIFFLIQMKGVEYFTPNRLMDKEFADALTQAASKGVKIIAYDAEVIENGIEMGNELKVVL